MTPYGIEVGWGQALLWFLLAIGAWFYSHCLYAAWDFFRHRRPEDEPSDDWRPPVTILKPLKGEDPGLYENLATFCRQRYPVFQIICGVADADDPSLRVVRRLQADFPAVDLEIVVDATLHGSNRKISNLINMTARAKHGVLAMSDSDIRVSEDYLTRVVSPLRRADVGLVTCLYRAVPRGGLATVFDALFVNTDFCHQVLLAREIEKARYAFGATIVLERATLEAAGGFERLADLLADDYFLGRFVTDLGKRTWLSDCVVDTVIDVGSFRKLLLHQVRWGRTFRSCRPRGYFMTIATHGTLWATVHLLVGPLAWSTVLASLSLLGLRLATTALISWRFLGTDLSATQILLVLPKDLFMSAIWLVSFLGDTVWWSGRRFRILPSGVMEPLPSETEPATGEAIAKAS
jgi:ceramide glucosyltransferase